MNWTSLKKVCLSGVGCIMISTAGADIAVADEINWSKYMMRSSSISAIAAAMSAVENCSLPLEFSERIKGDAIWLQVTCNGTEEEEGTATIEFRNYGDGQLSPERLSYAG